MHGRSYASIPDDKQGAHQNQKSTGGAKHGARKTNFRPGWYIEDMHSCRKAMAKTENDQNNEVDG